jgi:hypothetical protein
VACLFLVFSLLDVSLSSAQAEDTDPKGIDDTTWAPKLEPEVISSSDKTIKGKKKTSSLRKKGSKKAGKKSDETLPGEQLTITQVMEILKTTRDLSGKNLSGLQLVGINLGKCNLKGTDLSRANLERADLGESDLERADFTGANLKMSSLRQSNLKGANLERTILDGAIWKDSMVCAKGSIGQCRESAAASYGK